MMSRAQGRATICPYTESFIISKHLRVYLDNMISQSCTMSSKASTSDLKHKGLTFVSKTNSEPNENTTRFFNPSKRKASSGFPLSPSFHSFTHWNENSPLFLHFVVTALVLQRLLLRSWIKNMMWAQCRFRSILHNSFIVFNNVCGPRAS